MSRLGNIGGRLYRGEVSVEFVARKRLWYAISGLILVICIGALVFRGLNYSVEFKGGSVFKFSAPAAAPAQVSQAVSTAGGGTDAIVQKVGVGASSSWVVQTAKLTFAAQTKVQHAIASTFHLSANAVSTNFVGPSWGSQISQKALEALIAALIALAHDIVITIGVYTLTGFEVSPATVIGLLTILGYSLYDTVVVFDKVRENTAGLLATRRTTYSEAANLALNQTLVRSINTSLIALLPVVSILAVSVFLLGNGELKDLSLVLFVGMLSGTYSSICIATPVLADLKEREPEFRQLRKQIAQRAGSAKRQAKVAVGKASGPGPVTEDEAEEPAPDDEAAPAAPVTAGRPAGGSAGSRPTAGPRQQPRRPSAAQRRPSGKKKRR